MTEWTFYGDGGPPLWLMAIGLVVLSGLLIHWLRAEMASRREPLARWLPMTLVPMCLLFAWLAYNPVIVRTRIWQESKAVAAVLDRSRSMSLPLSPANLTARLDLLKILGKPGLDGRSRAAADLAEQLDDVNRDLAVQLAAVEALAALEAQAIPPGTPQEAMVAGYQKWRIKAAAAFVVGVEALVQQLPSLPAAMQAGDAQLVQAIDAARTRFAELPETLDSGAGNDLRGLSAAAAALISALWSAQEVLDTQWSDAHGEPLVTELESLDSITRHDLLRATARALPAGDTGLIDSTAEDESDLYRMCEQAFTNDKLQDAGHVVLLSDGAHNGSSSDHSLARIRDVGCGFTAVGIPQTAVSGMDPALRRWSAAPLVRAGKEATLSVTISLPAAMSSPPTLRLALAERVLAERSLPGAPEGISAHELTFTAPEPGRHVLRLELVAKEDAVPQNNRVWLVQESVAKMPRLLLIGDTPTWDAQYLSLAAMRLSLELDQVYHVGQAPKRGSFSGSVPKTPDQWQRKSAVILTGSPFSDFSNDDSAALRDMVVRGGTLLLFGTHHDGYVDRLAGTFGWNVASQAASGGLRLTPDHAHLPLVAVGADAAVSARRIAALPPLPTTAATAARAVPAQDLVLVETEAGTPVISLGFFGRGKVICWGLTDLYRMRDVDHRETVDRLLANLLAELSLPLLPQGSTNDVAFYPPLPVAGGKLLLVQWGQQPADVSVDGQEPLGFRQGRDNELASLILPAGEHRLSAGSWTGVIPAVLNPGQEFLAPALDTDRLQRMADTAGGQFFSAAAAGLHLASIDPGVRTITESAIYRPGRHWLVLALVLGFFTLHWVVRKLSGLVL